MKKSYFHIAKMDCPSEERLIRMALDGKSAIKKLDFDLSSRNLTIIHSGPTEKILSSLRPLSLGAVHTKTEDVSEREELLLSTQNLSQDAKEMSILRIVFIINMTMFVVGFISGWIAQSTGLIADSLDMFADAAVFGLSMYAVGRSQVLKKRAARLSGYLQMLLAIFVFIEVVRLFLFGSEPEAPYMMIVATISLIANSACMFLLAKHKDGEAHMQASWIFLSTDIIANIGVIIAALLVKLTGSHVPDLIAGTLIGIIVFTGSLKILKITR